MGIWKSIKDQIKEIADITAYIDVDDAGSRIRNNIWFRGPNVWILAFSIIVASVGLNVNSTAVIIGAMLISPLMGPIIGTGFALGTNDMPLLRQAARNLLIMVLISLLASSLFFLLSPLKLVNPTELEARTSPTIYDVLIALFGGLAGIFETSRRDRGTVLSGVAIATALMPPLCTAGYGLAHWNMHFFLGAMFLFTINGVFIALATYAAVIFFRFPQAKYIDAAKAKRQRRIISVIVLIVIVPSVWTAVNLIRLNNFERHVTAFVTDNRTFGGKRFIYDQKVSGTNQVEFSLTGEPLTDEEREAFLEDAEAYGIPRKGVTIKEHNFGVGTSEEMQKLVGGLYDRFYEELDKKEERIKNLESEVFRLMIRLNDTTAVATPPSQD